MRHLVWTDRKLEQLKLLLSEGVSRTGIAQELGAEFTKGAVSGMIQRLGLKKTPRQPQRETTKVARPRMVHTKARPRLPRSTIDLTLFTASELPEVTMLTLSDEHCRWPLEYAPQQMTGNAFFCGKPPKEEGPYCPKHHRLAFVRVNPLRRRRSAPRV